jgi:hypothetical protein
MKLGIKIHYWDEYLRIVNYNELMLHVFYNNTNITKLSSLMTRKDYSRPFFKRMFK